MISQKVQPNVSKTVWVGEGWGGEGRGGWGLGGCGLREALTLVLCQTPPPPPGHVLLLLSPSFSLSFFFSPLSRCLSGSLRLAANNAGVVRYHRLLLLRRAEAAQRLSRKRQTPVFCHSFDCYPSLLRTSPLCLLLRHSPRSDLLCLTVCLSGGICQHFCSWEKCACVCTLCDSPGGATIAQADFLMEWVGESKGLHAWF